MGANYDVRGATAEIIRCEGVKALGDSRFFASRMVDLVDRDSLEAKVLLVQCDDRFLAYFATGAQAATCEAMEEASSRATAELSQSRAIDVEFAQRLCGAISEGICDALCLQEGVVSQGEVHHDEANVDINGESVHWEAPKNRAMQHEDMRGQADAEPWLRGWLRSHWLVIEAALLVLLLLLVALGYWLASKAYTIDFDGNMATTGQVDSMRLSGPSELTLPDNGFVREGYAFAGWSEDADARSGVMPGDALSVDGPTTFYAIWLPLATFDGNGADEGKIESVAAGLDGALSLPECTFKRKDCVFRGWMDKGDREWDSREGDFRRQVLGVGSTVALSEPMSFAAVWDYGDNVTSQVSLDPVMSGMSEDGIGSGAVFYVTNNSPYTLDLNCNMDVQDRMYCLAPGQTSLAVFAKFGYYDWSEHSPSVQACAPLEGQSSLEGLYRIAENAVGNGSLEVEVVNTSGRKLRLHRARVLGRRADRQVVKEDNKIEAYGVLLEPGESITTGFGMFSNDDTDWPTYGRSYYVYGYAE